MNKRIVFHIDVNSAYLSWEAVYRLQHGAKLDLRKIPSAIGGSQEKRKGIVLARSMPARKYGIKTGESLYMARNKCPQLVVLPPNYPLYIQCSNAMMKILKEYSPIIQRYSIDEAFVDCGNIGGKAEQALELAYQIKDRIKSRLGFTVNIGISNNKLLAKMASDFKKPDRVHSLYIEEIREKMWPLAVEKLFFVGPATAKKLKTRGILTIGELAKTDVNYLKQWLKSHGLLIWQYANGIEDSAVQVDGPSIKGLGNSNTIAYDLLDRETAHQVLLALCETVGMRIRDIGKSAYLIAISIKNDKLVTYSHQKHLHVPISTTNCIYNNARELFDEAWREEAIRHLGVYLSSLSNGDTYQLSLFEKEADNLRNLDKTIDKIRLRYGRHAIIRSTFINSKISPFMGGITGVEEYPMMSSLL